MIHSNKSALISNIAQETQKQLAKRGWDFETGDIEEGLEIFDIDHNSALSLDELTELQIHTVRDATGTAARMNLDIPENAKDWEVLYAIHGTAYDFIVNSKQSFTTRVKEFFLGLFMFKD